MKWKPFAVGAAVIVAGYWLKGPAAVLREAPRLPDGRAIRVEVLNGSGITKAGLGLAEHLRGEGFDVVAIGNAPARSESTRVIDRVGDPRWATAVAKRLDVAVPIDDPDLERLVEVTVILGEDRGTNWGRDW